MQPTTIARRGGIDRFRRVVSHVAGRPSLRRKAKVCAAFSGNALGGSLGIQTHHRTDFWLIEGGVHSSEATSAVQKCQKTVGSQRLPPCPAGDDIGLVVSSLSRYERERERERWAWRVVCVKQRAPGGTVPCMEEQCEHR